MGSLLDGAGPGWGQGATNFAQQLWQSQNPGQPSANNPYAGAGPPAGFQQPPSNWGQGATNFAQQVWQNQNPGSQAPNPYAGAGAPVPMPGATPNMWDQLSKALGAGGGLQSGASGLANAFKPPTSMGPTAPSPMPSQMQQPTPTGMGAFFRAQQTPGSSSTGLSPQILALQQLMRG
jgi:hypothetical protein